MSRPRAAAQCLAYLAAVAVASLGADRLIAERLFAHPTVYVPNYRAFYEYSVGVKLHQFRHAGRRWDGLFIGNSLTLFAVDPQRFDRRLHHDGIDLRSYNLAMPSLSVEFWPPFFRRWYSAAPPPHLLLGVQPNDLDTRGVDAFHHFIADFFASEGFRNRNLSRISDWAENSVARAFVLWGRRGEPRQLQPGELLDGHKLDPTGGIRIANDRGWGKAAAATVAVGKLAAGRRRYGRRHGPAFRLAPVAGASIEQLAAWAHARGGELTLFTMPVLYQDNVFGTLEMRAGFRRALRRMAQRVSGLRFIDLGARVGPSYRLAEYLNENHLNERGSRRFSVQLADAFAAAEGWRGGGAYPSRARWHR